LPTLVFIYISVILNYFKSVHFYNVEDKKNKGQGMAAQSCKYQKFPTATKIFTVKPATAATTTAQNPYANFRSLLIYSH
jgi:hypothetical protein